MQSIRGHSIDDYKEQILALARIYYLLTASFTSEQQVIRHDAQPSHILDDQNSHVYHHRFLSWLELPINKNIKEIIQDFSQELLLALTDTAGTVHIELFTAFRETFSPLQNKHKNQHFSYGHLSRLYSFFSENLHHSWCLAMLAFLDKNSANLLWPASKWEHDIGLTRSLHIFEDLAKPIAVKVLEKILSKLKKIDQKDSSALFTLPLPLLYGLKSIVNTSLMAYEEKSYNTRDTTKDMFNTLSAFVLDQIKCLATSSESHDLSSTISICYISHIYKLLEKLALRLNILAFLYHPDMQPFSEPMFKIKDLTSIIELTEDDKKSKKI